MLEPLTGVAQDSQSFSEVSGYLIEWEAPLWLCEEAITWWGKGHLRQSGNSYVDLTFPKRIAISQGLFPTKVGRLPCIGGDAREER